MLLLVGMNFIPAISATNSHQPFPYMKSLCFRNWPMFYKILFNGLSIVLLFVASTFFLVLPKISGFLRSEKESTLQNLIQVAESSLNREVAKWKQGKISLEEAQSTVLEELRSLAYDGENYFWVNDLDCVMLMHPKSPELEGESMVDVKDPDGIYIFQEFTQVAKSEGQGFVHYMWPKPGEAKAMPKISYIVHQPDWDWVIGTGIYVEDIREKTNAVSFVIIGIMIVCGLLAVGLSVWVAYAIVVPIKKGVEFTKQVASGDLSATVECVRTDELGVLIEELNKMVVGLRELFHETHESVSVLNRSSEDIMAISEQIGATVQQTTAKASIVTGKSQGMNRNLGEIVNSAGRHLR